MCKPNAELINDRFKRAHHRLVARAMAHDPTILEKARARIGHPPSEPPEPLWVTWWRELLSRPLDEVRREITRPTQHMTELRISSPFALAFPMSDEQRIRLWKKISRTTHLAWNSGRLRHGHRRLRGKTEGGRGIG